MAMTPLNDPVLGEVPVDRNVITDITTASIEIHFVKTDIELPFWVEADVELFALVVADIELPALMKAGVELLLLAKADVELSLVAVRSLPEGWVSSIMSQVKVGEIDD